MDMKDGSTKVVQSTEIYGSRVSTVLYRSGLESDLVIWICNLTKDLLKQSDFQWNLNCSGFNLRTKRET